MLWRDRATSGLPSIIRHFASKKLIKKCDCAAAGVGPQAGSQA